MWIGLFLLKITVGSSLNIREESGGAAELDSKMLSTADFKGSSTKMAVGKKAQQGAGHLHHRRITKIVGTRVFHSPRMLLKASFVSRSVPA